MKQKVLQRVAKPSTRRGKKELLKRAPRASENDKQALIIHGATSSHKTRRVLKNLAAMKQPLVRILSAQASRRRKKEQSDRPRKQYLPFEDPFHFERLAQNFDSSLFAFESHNKKRPDNLVLGRTYDYRMLDVFELGVGEFKALEEFKTLKVSRGSKPCLVFTGERFEQDETYKRLKNLLVDFFRGEEGKQLQLKGLEHVITFAAMNEKIYMRTYKILLKKSGTNVPRVVLEEMGPSMDLVLRRKNVATEDLFKAACRKAPQLKIRKTKNITQDAFASTLGRIHMPKMDMSKLQTKKMKGLRGKKKGTQS